MFIDAFTYIYIYAIHLRLKSRGILALRINILKNKILNLLPEKGDLEADVYTKLVKQEKLSYTKFEYNYFNAVDSHKDLEDIDRDITSGKVGMLQLQL